MRMARIIGRAFVATLSLACWTACAAPREDNRWTRHFSGEVWSSAFDHQWTTTDRRVPELVLLGAVPVLLWLDSDIQEDHPHHWITSSIKGAADDTSIALGLGAVALAAWDWGAGDDGQHFEVATESLLAVSATTDVLKSVVGRRRPDSASHSSFPSGHTSFAFAGATLLLRDLEESVDPAYRPWTYLAYVPAALVGIERVEANRHWASDVAAGAFLGVFLTNWIYDAHVRERDESRATIFGGSTRFDWEPAIDVTEDGLSVGIRFGF